jgi:hypothetical protein
VDATEAASGDLVVMHDADDVSHPQRLEVTRSFFAKYPNTCQLNLGFIRFGCNDRLQFPLITVDNWAEFTVHLEEIDREMRAVFLEQRFSARTAGGIRFGGYGTRLPKCVSSGHVTYPREIVRAIQWPAKGEVVFTPYEDYEFNVLLYLAMRASCEIVLPLIGYRVGIYHEPGLGQ